MADRLATGEEIKVVQWLLEHTAIGDVSKLDPESLRGGRAFVACSCGCASVDFAPPEETVGSSIVAEAYAVGPDGAIVGVMLWARPQRICGIELYDLIGGDLSRFPSVDRLRRWEDYVPPDAPSISTER